MVKEIDPVLFYNENIFLYYDIDWTNWVCSRSLDHSLFNNALC